MSLWRRREKASENDELGSSFSTGSDTNQFNLYGEPQAGHKYQFIDPPTMRGSTNEPAGFEFLMWLGYHRPGFGGSSFEKANKKFSELIRAAAWAANHMSSPLLICPTRGAQKLWEQTGVTESFPVVIRSQQARP